MKYWLLPILLGAVLAAPAKAQSPRCYSPQEIEAEQTLRLHSELMVITVTCHRGSRGEDLVRAYTGFTRNNIDRLRQAEAAMTAYYKKNYGGDGVERLDRLRTLLANEYGQQIADESAPSFCKSRRDKVLVMHRANNSALSGEILQISGRNYEPPCSSLMKTAKKSR